MNNPVININFNKFLDPVFTGWIMAQEKYKDWTPLSTPEVLKKVENYKELWSKYNEKILNGLVDITGLKFSRNYFDIHIVTGNPRPFSSPIVMKSTYDDISFINTLTHELVHCLFMDNKKELGSVTIYEHENKTTSTHVMVHAILKSIYLDVLNEPERLEKNILESSNSNLGYKEAWQVVEKVGYKKILDKLKKSPSQ
ncbi:MAG: hypothetical protein WCP15_00235 [bacterium]